MAVDDFDRLPAPVDLPYDPGANEYGHDIFLDRTAKTGYRFTDCIDFFDGTPNGFLSNFHPSPMRLSLNPALVLVHSGVIEDLTNADRFDLLTREWPDGETAFQAFKMTTYDNFVRVAESGDPGQAKDRGRRYQMRSDWPEMRVHVMRMVLQAKFAPGTECGRQLLGTGTAVLIEGTTWGDRVWGVYNGKGQNLLGVLLTEQRGYLRYMESRGVE